MDRIKYTVALPKQTAEKLDGLATTENTTKAQIIRRSIDLYSYIHNEIISTDLKLHIVDINNTVIKEIILID